MKQLKQLMEARRNPEQNPVLDSYNELLKYRGDNNIFITYTSINKVGINPQNDFLTPTAIYAYPLSQMWSVLDKRKSTRDVPFAGNRKFIQVIKHNGQGKYIHDLHTKYTKSMFDKDMEYLRKNYSGSADGLDVWQKHYMKRVAKSIKDLQEMFEMIQTINKPDSIFRQGMSEKGLKKVRLWSNDILERLKYIPEINHPDARGAIEKIVNSTLELTEVLDFWDITFRTWTDPLEETTQEIREFGNDYKNSGVGGIESSIENGSALARHKSYGGKFWNVTRWVANNHQNPEGGMDGKSVANWNKVLRDLGYAGMADRSGKGIIHPGEPTQAIFLSTKGLKHIETINNKQVKQTFVVKNMNDIRRAIRIEDEKKNDLNRILQLITIKRNIKNLKDVRKIINNWIIKNPKTVIDAVKGNDKSPIFSWIAHENLFKKIKMDLSKRIGAYLYLVNPTMPFPYFPAFGLRPTIKRDQQIILNIAKYYNLGEVSTNQSFSQMASWAEDRMEKKKKMSKKQWDKEVMDQIQ